jgi:hypothetical protein
LLPSEVVYTAGDTNEFHTIELEVRLLLGDDSGTRHLATIGRKNLKGNDWQERMIMTALSIRGRPGASIRKKATGWISELRPTLSKMTDRFRDTVVVILWQNMLTDDD